MQTLNRRTSVKKILNVKMKEINNKLHITTITDAANGDGNGNGEDGCALCFTTEPDGPRPSPFWLISKNTLMLIQYRMNKELLIFLQSKKYVIILKIQKNQYHLNKLLKLSRMQIQAMISN